MFLARGSRSSTADLASASLVVNEQWKVDMGAFAYLIGAWAVRLMGLACNFRWKSANLVGGVGVGVGGMGSVCRNSE